MSFLAVAVNTTHNYMVVLIFVLFCILAICMLLHFVFFLDLSSNVLPYQ